ncbi:hypothetical protein Tco_1317266 [Tanacetum coccineum]
MTTLKFVDTYNMVAFLSKPAENEGFEQIVDFLNAHTIKHALTVNTTIYTLCIEQLWATVKAKTVNREVQLQALVDGKKIINTESIVRRDLQLEDAEGVDCLPNATIFEQLALMGYEKISQKLTFYKAFFFPQWKFLIHIILQCLSSKTTAWNEFSSTMASAIIYLATNQKFNFSKYSFESMVKNLDNVGKFLMYPRVGKGFSGKEMPLFQTMVVQHQEEMGEGSAMPTDPHHTPTIIQPSISQPQKKQKPRKPKRKDTQIPQSSGSIEYIADEAVYKELDDSLVKAATIATPNEPSSPGTSSGGSPRCQETIGDIIAQTRFENISKTSNDPLLARVLALETTKTTQANKIAGLKRRVKKLKRMNKSRTHRLKRLYKVSSSRIVESFDDEGLSEEDASKQGRITDIDANKDIYLGNVHTDEDMFGVNDLDGNEVIVDNVDVVKTVEETRSVVKEVTAVIKKAKLVSAAEEIVNAAATTVSTASTIPVSAATTTTTTVSDVEIILAQALAELKNAKPKADKEQAPTPTVSSQQPLQVKIHDKGKSKMVEPEPKKKMSKKDLLRLDKELAFKLQAEEDEEERLAREKAQQIKEVNIAWDDVQAKIEADYQLAQRLQAQEQEELIDEEKARLTELVEENSKKAEVEIAQERSSKRAGEELEQESSKKQKVDDDKETTELKSLMEVIPDEEEVAIDAVPLATKPSTIVDWKIHTEGRKSYYQIIRDDGSSKMYLVFSHMLKSFDREDLKTLYKLVKAKYGSTRPVEDLDLVLYEDLKTMFDPHVEDQQNVHIRMLVEKRYPLTPPTITDMLNKKLQVDYKCEMAFELLRLLSMKKLEILKKNIKFRRIVGIKSLLRVTAAKLNTASVKLVLLVKIEENILSSYYCLYTVNAAGV